MEGIVLGLYVLVAVIMIGLILLQQGKGADMGASFGSGASQTVFGSAGSTGFLTKLTWGLVFVFFVLSLLLAVMAKREVSGAVQPVAPAPVQSGSVSLPPASVTPRVPASGAGTAPALPLGPSAPGK